MSRDQRIDQSATSYCVCKFKTTVRRATYLMTSHVSLALWTLMFQSPSDGAPISPNQPSFGIPGQTKVSGDRQRETTREIFCLAAECTDVQLR